MYTNKCYIINKMKKKVKDLVNLYLYNRVT